MRAACVWVSVRACVWVCVRMGERAACGCACGVWVCATPTASMRARACLHARMRRAPVAVLSPTFCSLLGISPRSRMEYQRPIVFLFRLASCWLFSHARISMRNSGRLISPSPSASASAIIESMTLSGRGLPYIFFIACTSSAREMFPLESVSSFSKSCCRLSEDETIEFSATVHLVSGVDSESDHAPCGVPCGVRCGVRCGLRGIADRA